MIIALSGGVGGAKLALGLSRIMPPENLLVVVNTGDDFEHLGLAQMAGGTPRIAPVPVKFPDPGHHPDSTMFYS